MVNLVTGVQLVGWGRSWYHRGSPRHQVGIIQYFRLIGNHLTPRGCTRNLVTPVYVRSSGNSTFLVEELGYGSSYEAETSTYTLPRGYRRIGNDVIILGEQFTANLLPMYKEKYSNARRHVV
jgi:hypothetical protein